jgi:hypothetical protein
VKLCGETYKLHEALHQLMTLLKAWCDIQSHDASVRAILTSTRVGHFDRVDITH